MNQIRKRLWIILIPALCIAAAALFVIFQNQRRDPYPSPPKTVQVADIVGIRLNSRTNGKYFYLNKNGKWTCMFLKGVNIGLTLPTTDLDNPDIPYSTYLKWFSEISAMNANTIKVYTVMNPDFYNALYDYNRGHPKSILYLLQGIWFNEEEMSVIGDAFGENETILKQFERAALETVDIVHGKSDYTSYGSISKATYHKDVSEYVAGYIMGLEWSPDFVIKTDNAHPDRRFYSGKYLYTQNASPFESFLCQAGDFLVDYETSNYHAQHPVAFLNWSGTDPIKHSDEPDLQEDMVSVDTEHIQGTKAYAAGLFAAMDVYPYYPEFLNYQREYVNHRDPSGKTNPFRAYLGDLQNHYRVPVIVSEFGLSTSRGMAHKSIMGYNQGGISETDQGKMDVSMLEDIARERYAGAMVFSWQDEWFKQTWNTVKYAPADSIQRTVNEQSAEQHYGILSYDPGESENKCYPDGDLSEWSGDKPVSSTAEASLYLREDEGYLYMMGRFKKPFSFDKDKLAIGIGLTGRGNRSSSAYKLSFSDPADFLLVLDGKSRTRLLTNAYYDLFYYQYAKQNRVFPESMGTPKKDSGIFNPIKMLLSYQIVLPFDKTIPPQSYEAGLLKFGDANPKSPSYDSLADFYFEDNAFEIRIPWYLLSVVNPAERLQVDDFYQNGQISFCTFDRIGIGAARISASGITQVKMSSVPFNGWNTSTFHARLKRSYQIIRKGFLRVMKEYQ